MKLNREIENALSDTAAQLQQSILLCSKMQRQCGNPAGAVSEVQQARSSAHAAIKSCEQLLTALERHESSCHDDECAKFFSEMRKLSDHCIKELGEFINKVEDKGWCSSVTTRALQACDECYEKCTDYLQIPEQ